MVAYLGLQPAFTAGELAPSLSARVDMSKYQQGCKLLQNFKVQPHGGAVKRPGFILLDEIPGEAALIRFVFNNEQAYCLVFGEKWLQIFTHEGPILNDGGSRFQIASPYTLEQARSLSVAQSADVLYIACWGVPPTKLKRLLSVNHNQWAFETITFGAPLPAPGGVAVTLVGGGTGATYEYFVTAQDDDGKESQLSAGAETVGPPSNNWTARQSINITWGNVDGAKLYRLFKSAYGGIPGYIASTKGTSYTDINISPSLSAEGSPEYIEPFPDGDYPGVVGFYEQRLIFASTPQKPQTIWMSKSGDYSNFALYNPIADDSPLELTIAAAEVSSMCWLASLRTLVLGSTSTEWEISASQGAFSAKTAQVRVQSYIGSKKIKPIIVGNTVLHVTRSGTRIDNLKYDFGADSYGAQDLTIMAQHLFEKWGIADWAFQQHPDSIVWVVRDDGVLLGLTYQAEHEVVAWHQHHTQGEFKAVCSVPKGGSDSLFVLTKRHRLRPGFFIERMADEYIDGDFSRAVFMDCALTYCNPENPVTELTGLNHLEGLAVDILADGAVMLPQMVKDGKVSWKHPKSIVSVGLGYISKLETMPVEIMGADGSSVGHKKQINAISILFRNTVGAKVSISSGQKEEIKWRSTEPYGTAPKQFSGYKEAIIPSTAETGATVCVTSDTPVPMTILALAPQIKVT